MLSVLAPTCFLTQLVQFIFAEHDLDQFIAKLHVFLLEADDVEQLLLLRRKLFGAVLDFKLGCLVALPQFLDDLFEYAI